MAGRLDIRQALRVFQIVTRHGSRKEHEYHFRGIAASSDFDGYNLTLRDDVVALNIYFHNKYAFHGGSSGAVERFIDRLKSIDSAEPG